LRRAKIKTTQAEACATGPEHKRANHDSRITTHEITEVSPWDAVRKPKRKR
jgi:hypothetical protein